MATQNTSGGTTAPDGHEDGGTAARILEAYLSELKAVRATGAGVPETSYYPALSNLFNAVGKTLKPKVRCVMNLKNLGAGMPDGGLFTPDQLQGKGDGAPKADQPPARGAIEAKGTKPDVKAIVETQQVKDYLGRYGIVIVSNLREFRIVEKEANGQPVSREPFSLAADEKDFWQHKAVHPRATAQQQGEQFIEFLKRACLHAAPLVDPKDLAWFFASYARDALVRVEHQKQLSALQDVRLALEEALGMKFTGDKGDHFFRSTLVQTIFYGVFSSWVRWHRDNPDQSAKFDWQKAEWFLSVPFVRTLFEEITKPSRLKPLNLVEVLDWAAGVLNRVDRFTFFQNFQDRHAVQYFYEPFLEAYDPDLRKELGVWYTPPEIVEYQVARVDAVLRDELNLPDGLADSNVIVLDPCCGTGTYLVEVLRVIAATLRDKGGDALMADDLKTAAMTRIFGFEILPAPFVVSHLQLGLLLQNEGAPLSQPAGERVGVYLTNALTGWEPPKGAKQHLMFAELEQERDAAEHVKRDTKILVVLGNPPYNAFAGISPEEEQGLVEPYKGVYYTEKVTKGKAKTGPASKVRHYRLSDEPAKGGWGIKKFNLDDPYIRFFRLAERRIAEMSGKGVVSFISNHSWIAEPSFVILREHLLKSFDKFWIENLHGNRKISEYAPDGRTSETIFAIRGFSVGIQQGVATSLWVKTGATKEREATINSAQVYFRDDSDAAQAEDRRKQLLESLNDKDFEAAYEPAEPRRENRFSFQPEDVTGEYLTWPRLLDLAFVKSDGLFEKRGGALIDIDCDRLKTRMQDYFDGGLSWVEYRTRQTALTKDVARFNAKGARAKALKAESFDSGRLRRYAVRPFDTRWCYYTPVRPIWNEPRPVLWQNLPHADGFLVSRLKTGKGVPGSPMFFTRLLVDGQAISVNPSAFPLMVAPIAEKMDGVFGAPKPEANLSKASRLYLAELGIKDPDADSKTAALIWRHALAIGYSPAYLTENADGIQRDWPRIPLPSDRKALEASAALGEEIGALLDVEATVPGVTSKISPAIKTIGMITRVDGGVIDPLGRDLAITSGWGRAGKPGVTMSGKGKLSVRTYDEDEAKAIDAEATTRGISAQQATELLDAKTCDVYLNNAAYWRNIPLNVWEYCIGGYPVIKKWLSYREERILGRALKPEEAREVMNTARRIAAIILLQPKLDENFHKVKDSAYDWPKSNAPT
ncbi:MAG: type ISP restriction/modification enzyme [Pirellulales bacterium]